MLFCCNTDNKSISLKLIWKHIIVQWYNFHCKLSTVPVISNFIIHCACIYCLLLAMLKWFFSSLEQHYTNLIASYYFRHALCCIVKLYRYWLLVAVVLRNSTVCIHYIHQCWSQPCNARVESKPWLSSPHCVFTYGSPIISQMALYNYVAMYIL